MALAIGAHSLVYHVNLEGVSPLSTSGLTTQVSGSTFVLVALTLTGDFVSVSDNKSNTYVQVGTVQSYWGGGAELRVFCCIDGAGGSNHVFSLNKDEGREEYEATLIAIEVTGGVSEVDDYAQAYYEPLNEEDDPLTAGNVTTSAAGSMLITAAGPHWGGCTPGAGYTELEDLAVGDSLINAAAAYRVASAAGSYAGTMLTEWGAPGAIFLIALKEGSSAIAGTASVSAAAMTANATGQGAIAGTGAVVSAAAACSGSGTESVQGSAGVTMSAATATADGALATQANGASAAAAATAAGEGSEVVQASGGGVSAAATAAGEGVESIQGAGDASGSPATCAGTGFLVANVSGSAEAAPVAVAAEGAESSTSTVEASTASASGSAEGDVEIAGIVGSVAASSPGPTASMAGAVVVGGGAIADAGPVACAAIAVAGLAGTVESAAGIAGAVGAASLVASGAVHDAEASAHSASSSGVESTASVVELFVEPSIASATGVIQLSGIWGGVACSTVAPDAYGAGAELASGHIGAVARATSIDATGTLDIELAPSTLPSSFYSNMAALASRLLAGSQFGQVVSVSRYAPSVASAGGTVIKGAATSTSTANVVQLPIAIGAKEFGQDKRVMDDVLASKEVRFLVVAAASMTFEPAPFDEVALAGAKWRVSGVTAVNPAGTPLVYHVAMVRL